MLYAKTGEKFSHSASSPGKKISALFITDYETRFSRFLESRVKGSRAVSRLSASSPIRETDLLMLPRVWNRLSPSFKTLYFEATRIPDDYSTHLSPGGNFEIYYITGDPDAGVDETDTVGYGAPGNWRIQTAGPNGVPDYVDEVAWALDSSWSLHVDRSGFTAPLPFQDNRYISSRYKAVITALGPDDYGFTYVMGKQPGSSRGYTSLLHIRNHWNGATWQRLGYQDQPIDGIRVTCAHELFHAVQYAMTWNTTSGSDLDDFPLSFLEATAVLMEEIAFDYINDYLQYAASYFFNPRMPLFDESFGMEVYTNSILAKFIYEKAAPAPSISFFKKMMFDNYTAAKEFHQNLWDAATANGTSWPLLLNRFHAGSFYSGTRADTSRFIADAPFLGQWTYLTDTMPSSYTVSKQVAPYAQQIFAFLRDTSHADTLHLSFEGQATNQGSVPSPSWALSCIVRSTFRPDSIIMIPMGSEGKGWLRIEDWHSRRELVILATNGHPLQRRPMTVAIQRDPLPTDTGRRLHIFPNPGRLSSDTVRFRAPDITEIRIYSAGGPLVCAGTRSRPGSFRLEGSDFRWDLKTAGGKKVAPGTYLATIIRKDRISGSTTSTRRKILVFP